eukprot:Gb_15066 [translate_table: standard]
MDQLTSLFSSASSKPSHHSGTSEAHVEGQGQHHGHQNNPSSAELMESAQLIFGAAKSKLQHGGGKGSEAEEIDMGRLAGAAGEILSAAKHYGKLDENSSYGKYVQKAEAYLESYEQTPHKTGAGGAPVHHRPPSSDYSEETGYEENRHGKHTSYQDEDNYGKQSSYADEKTGYEENRHGKHPSYEDEDNYGKQSSYADEKTGYEENRHGKHTSYQDEDNYGKQSSYADEKTGYEENRHGKHPSYEDEDNYGKQSSYADEKTGYEENRHGKHTSYQDEDNYGKQSSYADEETGYEENRHGKHTSYADESKHGKHSSSEEAEDEKYAKYFEKAEEYLSQ